MIRPEVLAERFRKAAVLLEVKGPVAWQRLDDWETATMPRLVEPMTDDGEARVIAGRSEDDEEDSKADAAAARKKQEMARVLSSIDADLYRLTAIITSCDPPNPKRLANRDLQAPQVAAAGFCVCCWRAGELKEIDLQPSGKPFYKDLCRWCGQWKGEHGQLPPVWIVAKHHLPGRRVTTADVEKATGKAS